MRGVRVKAPHVLPASLHDTVGDVAAGGTFYTGTGVGQPYLKTNSHTRAGYLLCVKLVDGALVELAPDTPVRVVELVADTTDDNW